ncbi:MULTISPECIES: ethanolamine utilization protein EutQ [unclassified Streptococcus]|uniref:ethanolamine utilization protein EutQ n=1 Tax=unclassified Streptococcus TaxID=2608887 RepID=UPI0018AA51E6|nr:MULTISPECIES: ethanolamine utilization protein EutQ [unclassified Streptococcus]MBF8969689.1 ethanolamine utilization protein EutQ [Streptococcus sp. NLN76]MBG9366608.1 ethanolamine utilization protein EutQ [Streptococcus sp. NLN64]MBJ6744900.1 ethanolamine utilization protein EutQ [Streptococcus sp. 121]
MSQINRELLEKLVRQIILEELGTESSTKKVSKAGVISLAVNQMDVRPEDRLDTGNAQDQVYTRDLISLEESPRLGFGLMTMEDTTFSWHLDYDEVDFVIDGQLDIIVGDEVMSAGPGQALFIPKGSDIQFSVKGKARFVYITYPADWQNS